MRWMSPELFDPEQFGPVLSRPTKYSDCYALGMVIYETISGRLPFYQCAGGTILLKIMKGERPPQEPWFTGGLWKMLQKCWSPEPNDRPSVEEVLRCLEQAPNPLPSPPPRVEDDVRDSGGYLDSPSHSTGTPSQFISPTMSHSLSASYTDAHLLRSERIIFS
jgi:hypothetical protein